MLNTAAQLVTSSPRSSHITPVLQELHWLLVSHRIQFKIALLTFKAFYGLAPVYVTDLLTPYTPTRSLRSAGKNLLVVPSYRLKSFGARSFVCVVPSIWNGLPDELRIISSLSMFKTELKSYLLQDAYKL